MRYLFIGAHPDDPDLLMGGTALKLIRKGHNVKFVSLCNGNRGHYQLSPVKLSARRQKEAESSAKFAGLDSYDILNNSDCELENTIENRKEIVKIIRKFAPDVVISHRPYDYHADHRITGQLVMDAAYILKVPLFCPETPIPEINPVFAYAYDRFTKPAQLQPDAVVEIDSVIEDKFKMLDCHTSQFYEWLPFDKGLKDFSATRLSWEQKKNHLDFHWGIRFKDAAILGKKQLQKHYARDVEYAEIFEYSPYGREVYPQDFQALFD
jgi:LmbE family N-acetylglucosaminyl deacetylase